MQKYCTSTYNLILNQDPRLWREDDESFLYQQVSFPIDIKETLRETLPMKSSSTGFYKQTSCTFSIIFSSRGHADNKSGFCCNWSSPGKQAFSSPKFEERLSSNEQSKMPEDGIDGSSQFAGVRPNSASDGGIRASFLISRACGLSSSTALSNRISVFYDNYLIFTNMIGQQTSNNRRPFHAIKLFCRITYLWTYFKIEMCLG